MKTLGILILLLLALGAGSAQLRATPSNCGVAAARLVVPATLRDEIRAGTQAVKKVSVVIPVYREWANGNLRKTLENFVGQTAAKNQFEIVLVVNNSKQARAADSEAYRDNQAALAALRELRADGLNIRVIDQTEGVARNMGKIRDDGFRDVLGRHRARPEDCLVATLDADTTVEPGYIENAIVHFTAHQGLGALYMPMELKIEPGSDERLYRQTHEVRRRWAASHFREASKFFWEMGGPQIIATAAALEKVGGVPHSERAENVDLQRRLNLQVPVINAPDMHVVTADRARADGFFGAMRQRDVERGYADSGMNMDQIYRDLASSAMDKLALRAPRFGQKEIDETLGYFGLEIEPSVWKKAVADTRGWWFGKPHYAEAWKTILPTRLIPKAGGRYDLVGFFRGKTAGEERERFNRLLTEARQKDEQTIAQARDALRTRIAEVRARATLTPHPGVEFFDGNTWIDALIRGQANQAPEQTFTSIVERYPEWFKPLDESPMRAETATLRAIARFMREAHARPTEFPGANEIANRVGMTPTRTTYK